MSRTGTKKTLVLGGGAAGQRASADLMNAGVEVVLVEQDDTLGGTMARLGTMFPTHNCLLCRGEEKHGNGCTRPAVSSDMLDFSRPDKLDVRTRSRVIRVEEAGGADPGAGYIVTVQTEPRYVVPEKCILCDRCSEVCPQSLSDPFESGLTARKAAYLPDERCIPESYAVEKGIYCEDCGKCQDACPTGAIQLNQKPATEDIPVDAIVIASGMKLYDPFLSGEYGYGRFPNVISGLEMERMLSPAGPWEGTCFRPSDGAAPEKIAWLQCVGSRDEIHDYCSSFCCGYATKQAVLARRLLPAVEASVFMMDDRVFGRNFSATYDPLRREHDISLEQCRISVLRQEAESKDLILQVTGEDGSVREERFGMVVLSIGAEAGLEQKRIKELFGLDSDESGFIHTDTFLPQDTARPGIFVAGTASGPADLSDSVTAGSASAARVCSYLGVSAATGFIAPAEEAAPLSGPGTAQAGDNPRPRIGVFACDCAGEIGGVVDLQSIFSGLTWGGENGGPLRGDSLIREIVPFGCFPEGIEAIRRTIQDKNLTHAVIGACKRRTYTPLFEKSLPVPVEFVSLREECSYVHRDDPEGATSKAARIIGAGVERIRRRAERPAAGTIQLEPERAVLVQGGGLAGLTAALFIAETNIPVQLVEHESRLGGNALRLNTTPEGIDVPAFVEELAAKAVNHPLISVYTESEVADMVSSKGTFYARLGSAELRPTGTAPGAGSMEERVLTAGAVVIATGGEEYRGPVFGLGTSEKTMTLLDLGRRMRKEPDLPSRTEELVFVGCVGPWNEPGSHSAWRCSRNCCETMIRQAKTFREANPECRVAVLVREVNTYGFREEEYTAARKSGVLFVRYDPEELPVITEENGKVGVQVRDTSIGEVLEFSPDMVVLSAAILPRRDTPPFARAVQVPLGDDGFFTEWESKTRPYSSLEPGVSICGLSHGPKPLRETVTQALAAGRNALDTISRAKTIETGSIARVDTGVCVSCLTCVRTCPYSVPRIGKEGFPRDGRQGKAFIDIFRCQGCGTCVSECPAGAVHLERFETEGTLEDTNASAAEAGITVISCTYCGNIPVEFAGIGKHGYPADVNIITVPCTGLVTTKSILDTLENGSMGVLVHACPEGTCHHLSGNIRARKRLEYVASLLSATGTDAERVRFADLGIGQGKAFSELVTEYAEKLRNKGEIKNGEHRPVRIS